MRRVFIIDGGFGGAGISPPAFLPVEQYGQALIPMADSEISVLQASLACRCPRCGRGALFAGLLDIKPACLNCGLDFSRMDVGDGFVVPILMVLGFMVVGAAIWFDFTFQPPLWLHAVIWPPVTVFLAVIMTRYLKSFLAVQQYHVRKTEMGL